MTRAAPLSAASIINRPLCSAALDRTATAAPVAVPPVPSTATDTYAGKSALDAPLYAQGLINPNAQAFMTELAKRYPERNSANPGRLNTFPADNKGETVQNRLGLQETARRQGFAIFDIEGSKAIDWSKGEKPTSDAAAVLAVDKSNLHKPRSPVLLVFVSNTHVANDVLSTPAMKKIKDMGITLAVLDYPGYGGSLGKPGRDNWAQAGAGAVELLQKLTGKKVALLGHSIGGAVAFDVAAKTPDKLSSVVTFGSIYSLVDMAADQKKYRFLPGFVGRALNKIICRLSVSDHLFNPEAGIDALEKAGVPLNVIHGADDGSVPVSHQQMFAERFAKVGTTKAKTTTLAAGHEDLYLHTTSAFDKFWAETRDALGMAK